MTTARPALPVADRVARGKAARRAVPRSSHAEWEPARGRRDPVDVLVEEAEHRVPELVPIRHGRMLASPFTYFRGAAAIMAADLAETPSSGLEAQLCGDAHLSNFGIFAAPDRRLVFDLNDFDETHQGPWEWDVKRLAASLEIAARSLGVPGRRRRAITRATVRSYREAMRSFAAMTNLAVWYARMDVEDVLAVAARSGGTGEHARRAVGRARRKDSARATAKLTERVDGELRFLDAPPLLERVESLLPVGAAREFRRTLEGILDTYAASLDEDRRRLLAGYRVVDMARKVVGVGSVGTRAWIVLLQGRDDADPLILQAKEAGASVLEPYTASTPYANAGERVVRGQRLMQAASDILLGWLHVTGIDDRPRDFYVRQLWDGKGSIEVDQLSPEQLATYGGLCAWALARAHARSGDRVAIAAYLGSGPVFDDALAEFAARYADRNEADFAALERAVEDGRLAVQDG